MISKAQTVKQYLAGLPSERRKSLEAVRAVILKNLDDGYEEGMQHGMISYFVPHRVYPAGYHCDPSQPLPFAGLTSRKGYMSLSLMGIYAREKQKQWFCKARAKTGKKLDMGKACIRFKKVEDVPLTVIGQAIARLPVKKFIACYEAATQTSGEKQR